MALGKALYPAGGEAEAEGEEGGEGGVARWIEEEDGMVDEGPMDGDDASGAGEARDAEEGVSRDECRRVLSRLVERCWRCAVHAVGLRRFCI